MQVFESINRGYNRVFQPQRLSLGLIIPIESYPAGTVPSLADHLQRARYAEQLGFSALWVRDVPLHVPAFGDAGQTYDPFTYLGYLAGQTQKIALCTGSIALPLHHPLQVAKAAATIDQLSGGRLILGVASGDRPSEYPAMGISFERRGELFREAFEYIRSTQGSFPVHQSSDYGYLNGQADVLPKANGTKIPLLVTGNSRQSLSWISEQADGWMYYPRNLAMQGSNLAQWQALNRQQEFAKPFMQPFYLDLHANDDFQPQPIHLGLRMGIKPLLEYLHQLQQLGVNHLAFNLRFSSRKVETVMDELAEKVLPHFHIS
ncbi:MAG: LLM class oxidoreductase [Bacteroidota bacterium]